MADIETAVKELTEENKELRQELAAMREQVADIREAFDHLPAPTKPVDEAALAERIKNAVVSVIPLPAPASAKTSSSSSSDDDTTWKIAVASAAAVFLLLFASPFIAVHTSDNIDRAENIEETADKILWNQNYAGTQNAEGETQTATPFTQRGKFYKWWNNQQSYINSQQQPQQ